MFHEYDFHALRILQIKWDSPTLEFEVGLPDSQHGSVGNRRRMWKIIFRASSGTQVSNVCVEDRYGIPIAIQ